MTYSSTVLSHAPAMYLPMTETTGPSLNDASGNGHFGSLPGGSTAIIGAADGFLSGEVGVSFPNSSAAVAFDFGPGFPGFSAWTVDFWARMHASADLQQVWFQGGSSSYLESAIVQADPTTIQSVSTVRLPPLVFGSAPYALPHFNCWHYYSVVFDGAGNVLFYVDGTLIETNNNPSGAGLGFLLDTGGLWFNQTSGAAAFDLMHSALYPSALSGGDIAALYAAATPRQDAACFLAPIRLRHSSGHVVFESDDETTRLRAGGADVVTHDGTTMSVYSGGTRRLRVPIPSAPAPPTRWVGLDPTGALAVHDVLPVTATASLAPVVPPVPVTTSTPTCDPLRCGAATKMKDHLQSLYVAWARVLSPALKLVLKVGVDAAISALFELSVDAVGVGPFAPAVWAAIEPTIATLLTISLPDLVPTLTPDQTTLLINGAYCQLTCDGNVVDPTSAQVQAWNAYLTGHAGSFVTPSLQLALLNALLDFTPLLDWQSAAATATSSGACATMTCP